jgi:hypothetical protein
MLFAVAAVLALAAPAVAQQKGRKVAFLVGVGEFKHDIDNLNGSPQKDVTELARVLADGGFEVVKLIDKDATRVAVEERFKQVVEGSGRRKALGKGDVLLVAVCTHGFTLPPTPGQPDAPFLAAHDSKLDQPGTMVSLNALIADGKGSGATVLYLIDACREIKDVNRGQQRGVGPDQVMLPKGTAILFGCGRGQVSHQNEAVGGHGLFTFAVLKVLRGDAGIKDEVTWTGLAFEVEKQFRSTEFQKLIPSGRPQSPVLAAAEVGNIVLMPAGNPLAADERAYLAALNKGEQARTEYLRTVVPTRLAVWRDAAEKGNPTAQVLYGLCFISNVGVRQDEAEAARWFRKAADAGHPTAMTFLGAMYANGKGGLNKDEGEAVRWYKKAADAGDTKCAFNLGLMYANGKGVRKDEAEAVGWYKKAADAGHPRAMTNLGIMYANGRGVRKDEVEAAQWFRKAADAGDPPGMTNLGAMYANGKGVESNEEEAVRWYKKAADAGDPRGMGGLGVMYEFGKGGLTEDEAEAVRWYRKAAELGDDFAKQQLKRLGKE